MATREHKICEQYSALVPELGDCPESSVLNFRVGDSMVELWGTVDVASLLERVLAETLVLFDKLERGEQLLNSPFADLSVSKGPNWQDVRNRVALPALVEKCVVEGLNKELNLALERTANISTRLLDESVFIAGLVLEAHGIWRIAEGGKHICKEFTNSISDKEAESIAQICAASPGGWTPEKIRELKRLKQEYMPVLREARKAYSKRITRWREQRRDLLARYPEMADVVDKIPVRDFKIADLAFQVASKGLSVSASESYLRKLGYGSKKSPNRP